MAIVRPFHRYRGETSIELPRLVAILKEQTPLVAPKQTRYRVTTLPTERTIRFYTSRGLVDKPAEHKGRLALYNFRHLLQILAVKYLQSHYLPLRKIKSLVEGASNRDLEQLMPEIAPSVWSHRGFTRHDRRVSADEALYAAGRVRPAWRSDTLAVPASPATTDTAGIAPVEPLPVTADQDSWHRLEVGPGIELHVHAVALAADQRERLRGVLLRELGLLRGWFEGSGKG